MGRRAQSTGVPRKGENAAQASAKMVRANSPSWPRDQGPAASVDEIDGLPATAVTHDALWQMDQRRFGDCLRPGGRGGAAFGGRAVRLCRHALATRQGGSLAAFAVHRVEPRLGEIHHVVSTQYASSLEKR